MSTKKINSKKLFYVLTATWCFLVLAITLPQVIDNFRDWKRQDDRAWSIQLEAMQTREWESCARSNPISAAESQKLRTCLDKINLDGYGLYHKEDARKMCRNFSIQACRYVAAEVPLVNEKQKIYRKATSQRYKAYSSILSKTFRWLSYTRYSGIFWLMISLLFIGPLAFAFGSKLWLIFKEWIMEK